MAVDMFFKIGTIKGESKADKHVGEIDVLAWSWGMSNSGTAHMGGGAGAGKVSMQDISFTKYIDNSTNELCLCCASGDHIGEALLTVRKAGKEQQEYLKIKLEDVFVSSYSTGGSGGEDRLTENITLNFAKVLLEYSEQKEDGSLAAAKPFSWDIPAGKKA